MESRGIKKRKEKKVTQLIPNLDLLNEILLI